MLQQPKLPDQRAAVEAMQAEVTRQIGEFDLHDAHSTLYLVVEHVLDPKLGRFAQKRLASRRHVVLFEGTPEHHLAQFSPWLVALYGEPDPHLLSQLCIASQTHAAVMWLWSPLGLDALADHLRWFMGATLWNEASGEIEGEVLVRLTDARVFPGLIEILLPEQRENLLRPINAWGLWDRHLSWRLWEGAGNAEPFDLQPLRISLAQLAQLDRHSQADKILSLLDDDFGKEAGADNAVWEGLLQSPLDVRYRAVLSLIEIGRRIGYATDQDLTLFVALAYQVHPRFFELPLFGAAIRLGARENKPLSATVAALPDHVWLEVEHAHYQHHSN